MSKIYYDPNETLSHNKLFNYIVGSRGCGKTYGLLKRGIKNFLRDGSQFIYLRRYKTEISKDNLQGIFSAIIMNDEFPDHTLEVKNKSFYCDGKLMGGAMALSMGIVKKGVNFPLVTLVIFDEFLIDKGAYKYLPDEPKMFAELIVTISRYRPIISFLLANSITMSNPYFLRYKLYLPFNTLIYKNGEHLLQLVVNKDYIDKVSSTRMGKALIDSDPDYANYAINNAFMLDNKNFVEKKSGNAKHLFILKYKATDYGIWVDYLEGKIYFTSNVDKSCHIVYALTTNDHTPNTLLISKCKQSPYLKMFIDNYKLGNLRFENMNIKNVCYDIIRLIG